jgi:hypothetical protein
VVVQGNTIVNSISGGIYLDDLQYEGVDLGGGQWGGAGGNQFSQSPGTLTNYIADVFLSTNGFSDSTANVFALHNNWSDPTNRESVIFDRLDNPLLGRVITADRVIQSASRNAGNEPVLVWNERGAGEAYTVEFTADLTSGVWTNAPGTWPITNPSLQTAMSWTNSSEVASNVFYRIHSQVP